MKATVVIPTYDRSVRLAALLRCLESQSGDHLLKVAVCDDGSRDDTAEVAGAFATRLPLVYCRQEHRGIRAGQARNLGLARAAGDFVVFLDDDTLVGRDFLAAHAAAHAPRRRRIAIGYRHRVPRFDGVQPSGRDIVSGEPDERQKQFGADAAGLAVHPRPWRFGWTCNLSVTHGTEVRFDEGFVGWGMEDVELGYRLVRAGYEVVFAPGSEVLHVDDARPRDPYFSVRRSQPPDWGSSIRNAVYFMDKYPHDAELGRFIRRLLRLHRFDEERGEWVRTPMRTTPTPSSRAAADSDSRSHSAAHAAGVALARRYLRAPQGAERSDRE